MSCKENFTFRKWPKDQKQLCLMCWYLYWKGGLLSALGTAWRVEDLCSLLLSLCFPSQFSSDLSAIIFCRTLEAAQLCLSLCRYRKRACIVQSWQHGRVCSTSLQITSGCYRQVGWMIRFISSTAHRKITLKLAWFKQTNKHKNTHYAQEVSVSQLLLRAYLHLIFTDMSY